MARNLSRDLPLHDNKSDFQTFTQNTSHHEDASKTALSRKKIYTHALKMLLVLCGLLLLKQTYFKHFDALRDTLTVEHDSIASQTDAEWTTCGDNLECARLEVPLDYTNTTSGSASLSLIRYPVKNKETRLGSILTNPGGPGGSGLRFVKAAGQSMSVLTGGRYDIVSWDPRGIGETTPPVTCFDNLSDEEMFVVNTEEEYHSVGLWNYSDPIGVAVFDSHYRIQHMRVKTYADLCTKKSGHIFPFVGTTTVVKDMDQILRAIDGEDALFNYWGFSYGTVIGSYLINMFPERVGRVILDGVVNPVSWANSFDYHSDMFDLGTAELALHNFYEGCVEAGPERCALANTSSTAPSLSKQVDAYLSGLTSKPLPVSGIARPGILTAGMVLSSMFSYLYRPRAWPVLADFLASAMKGDPIPLMNSIHRPITLDPKRPADTRMAGLPVFCADGPGYSGDDADTVIEEIVRQTVQHGREVSPHFATLNYGSCQLWGREDTRPKDRFAGPFNSSLNNVVLVIGNMADPATPLANAKIVNDLLSNSSRLIIQDGSGHCSTAQASLCTVRAITDYFNKGSLPEDGLVCGIDEELFPPSKASLGEGANTYSSEDLLLLEAAQNIGDYLVSFWP